MTILSCTVIKLFLRGSAKIPVVWTVKIVIEGKVLSSELLGAFYKHAYFIPNRVSLNFGTKKSRKSSKSAQLTQLLFSKAGLV